MKKITWTRPHLTSFGKHQVLPGESMIEDTVATEISKHWAFERSAKAGLVKIEDVKATAPKAADKTETAAVANVGTGKGSKKKGAASDA
jgi:hypothetical protein